MPLTQTQNKETWIVRSLRDYLNTNVVTPYNAAVTGTNYDTALGIELEWPDDPDMVPVMPVIILSTPTDVRDQLGTGLGDRIVWKTKQFCMYCFPAITTENKPSLSAAAILKDQLDFALGTGLYIPLYDYTTPNSPVQSEAAQVVESRIIKPNHLYAPLLNIQRHAFDYLLNIKYPVSTIGG